MLAGLGGGEDVSSRLDRPGAQQGLPMGLAGRHGEGRGDGEDLGAALGEAAVERREAQVVADGHAEADPGGGRDDGLAAGAEGGGFAVALPRAEIDVEHVDLVVARDDAAVRAEEQAAVDEAIVAGGVRFQQEAADQQPDAQVGGDGAEASERQVLGLAGQQRGLAGAAGADEVGAFGGEDQPRALAGRVADQRLGLGEVGGGIVAAAELDQAGAQRQPASSGSSLPARSRAERSS